MFYNGCATFTYLAGVFAFGKLIQSFLYVCELFPAWNAFVLDLWELFVNDVDLELLIVVLTKCNELFGPKDNLTRCKELFRLASK